ncbi:MAG: hypothetical protein EOO89_00080 [Pedobacter sp.]|nr:MAG: hypothetical protein EOO89_00080 [Pedobacter sp.]
MIEPWSGVLELSRYTQAILNASCKLRVNIIMPRKKKEQELATYIIPERSAKAIDQIITIDKRYKKKHIWRQKFYELFDHIAAQQGTDAAKYVNINISIMAKRLSVDNQQMSSMLRDCIENDILEKDGVMVIAVRNAQGYIKEGKSFGYRFVNGGKLAIVELLVNKKHRSKDIDQNCKFTKDEQLRLYDDVISKVTIETNSLNDVFAKVLENKWEKYKVESEYNEYINNKISELSNNNNNKCIIIPFDGVIVPAVSQFISEKRGQFCHPCKFSIRRKRKHLKPVQKIESNETTIARCRRSIEIINNGFIKSERPVEDSRVYNVLTNLKREFRPHLRLNSQPLIAIDIRNSQPLIACILIRQYWLQRQGFLPDDVIAYQKACEAGRFYDDFMKELSLPDQFRSFFKADFFRKVFFSMVTDKTNLLKQMFIRHYPSVWQMICDEKGGLFSRSYNEFAKKLQMVEAQLIFDIVNINLIKQGIPVFNIFDAIYVTSLVDYSVAERSLRDTFREAGLNPTFNMECY